MKIKLLLLSSLFLISLGFILIVKNQTTSIKSAKSQTTDSKIQAAKTENLTQTSSNRVKVIRVIDGDTVEIEGGAKIRYIGIDTPETVHPEKPVECFGREASDKNRQLVEGKEVTLEKDVSQTDKYGRLLRYVYIDQTFVNDYLVRQGYAHSSTYPPDVKYQDQFKQAEQEARDNNRGLWSNCNSNYIPPTPAQNQSAPNPDCAIKGNISSTGEKIYHVPGQYYYDKTQIDESRGERWFCTEDEAVAAGWRKSKK